MIDTPDSPTEPAEVDEAFIYSLELETILADIESAINGLSEDALLEAQMSINDWIDRIKGTSIQAHNFARAGMVANERESWITIAAVAARRVKQLDLAAQDPE